MENTKVDLNLKEVFTKKIILTGLFIYILLISIILASGYGILLKTYSDIYNKYEDGLNVESFKYSTELDVCYILDCFKYKTVYPDGSKEYIFVDENGPYHTSEFRFKEPDMLFNNITSNLNIKVKVKGTEYYINNKYIKEGLYNTFIVVTPLIFIMFTIIYIPLYLKYIKRKLIEKGKYKSELESKLARDLTEMLHHEMGAPLGVIKTQTDELLMNIYPTKFIPIKKGNSTEDLGLTSEKDLLNVELFRSLYLGITRLESILALIAGAKHIRFSNGTVPIVNIITNIASSVNSFKLKKVLVRGAEDKLFKEYSVIHEYGNGNMLNALHVLFNNAMEASADMIELDGKLITMGSRLMMEIYIKDNGTGILDKYGNPDKSGNIFKYGYTTKGKDYSEKIIVKILKILGFNLVEIDSPKRGIGLYITKQLLKNVGGDLIIEETGKNGTTFKMTVPVKKTIYT